MTSQIQQFAYNPQFLTDQDLERVFIIRQQELQAILGDITSTKPGQAPGHHLLIGQRGMGKSTLLRKLAAELRKAGNKEKFIPLSFAEEQYIEVKNLSEFWLNCLDSLADAYEREGDEKEAEAIDALISKLKQLDTTAEGSEFEIGESFQALIRGTDRRLVLLVDNFAPLMKKIGADEFTFRSFLTQDTAPIMVAASLTQPRDSTDHSKALYEAFKPKILRPLSVSEIQQILVTLAEVRGDKDLVPVIRREASKLHVLKDLSGGNPRTVHYIYSIFKQGLSNSITSDLKHLIDDMTAVYQSYFDQLSELQADIVSCLARNLHPITAAQIAEHKNLNRSCISPQLARLEDIGLVEPVDLFQTKKTGYQIAERFFNLWYAFRFFSRRERLHLNWITKFLQDFYHQDELCSITANLLKNRNIKQEDTEFALMLSEAVNDQDLAGRLLAKTELSILKATRGHQKKIEEIIGKDKSISQISYDMHELREKLIRITPDEKKDRAEEFADLVMGSFSTLDMRDQIADSTLNTEGWEQLVDIYEEERRNILQLFKDSKEDLEWFSENLSLGRLESTTDIDGIKKLIAHKPFVFLIEIAVNLQLYDEAEEAYKKAIESDPENSNAWNGLGNLLQDHLGRYDEAEEAYKKAIESDPDYSNAWNGLGNLLQDHLGRYDEAEEAYKKAIESDSENSYAWYGLGNLLQDHLGRYDEAEEAYKKAIESDPENSYAWNGLGNLYADYLHKPVEAKNSYMKAIQVDPENDSPEHNLIFLERDIFGNLTQAREMFDSLKPSTGNPDIEYLQRFAFALYDENWGDAKGLLDKALEATERRLPSSTRDDWFRVFAVAVRLGFSQKLLDHLYLINADIELQPLVEALKAHQLGSIDHVLNIAKEIRPVTKVIYKEIGKRVASYGKGDRA